jgi:hypothetical protein
MSDVSPDAAKRAFHKTLKVVHIKGDSRNCWGASGRVRTHARGWILLFQDVNPFIYI